MMFDEIAKNQIHKKIKTETRRLYNSNKRPAIPGTIHKIKIDSSKRVYGEIEILSCEIQRFGDIDEEDVYNEGFLNVGSYKKHFYKIYGTISDDDLVWVVKFKPIWTSKEGIIL